LTVEAETGAAGVFNIPPTKAIMMNNREILFIALLPGKLASHLIGFWRIELAYPQSKIMK